MSSVELEAAQAKIEELQRMLNKSEQNADNLNLSLASLARELATMKRTAAEREVELGQQIRTLKDAIVEMVTVKRVPMEPSNPVTQPASPRQTLNMLSEMIAAEQAAQEQDWERRAK